MTYVSSIPRVAGLAVAAVMATATAAAQQPSNPLAVVSITTAEGDRSRVIADIAAIGREYGLAVIADPERASLQMYSIDLAVMGSENLPWDPYGVRLEIYDGHFEPFERRLDELLRHIELYVSSRPTLGVEIERAADVDPSQGGEAGIE